MAREHVFAWEGTCKLVVDVGSGKLLVRGWSNDEVKILDEVGGAAVTKKKGRVYVEGKDIQLSVYLPIVSDIVVDATTLDVDLGGLEGRAELDLTEGTVKVQNWHGDLEIDSTKGNISLNQLRGNCQIDTGEGSISLAGCHGAFTLDTGDGSIDLSDSQGTLTADTGNGRVSLWHFRGPVTVDTGTGDVELKDVTSRNVVVDTGTGNITANLPGGNPGRWSLDTGKGDVNLTIPADTSLRLEFHSGNDIKADSLPLEEMLHRTGRLSGILGDGRGRLDVTSNSGVISAKASPAQGIYEDSSPSQEVDEESLKILAMLEQGSITIAEAEALLDALRGIKQEDEGTGGISDEG